MSKFEVGFETLSLSIIENAELKIQDTELWAKQAPNGRERGMVFCPE